MGLLSGLFGGAKKTKEKRISPEELTWDKIVTYVAELRADGRLTPMQGVKLRAWNEQPKVPAHLIKKYGLDVSKADNKHNNAFTAKQLYGIDHPEVDEDFDKSVMDNLPQFFVLHLLGEGSYLINRDGKKYAVYAVKFR